MRSALPLAVCALLSLCLAACDSSGGVDPGDGLKSAGPQAREVQARGLVDSVDVRAFFRIPEGLAVRFALSADTAVRASIAGTWLRLAPRTPGQHTVNVTASADGQSKVSTRLVVTATSDWCTPPPTGVVDPVPFVTGQVVSFKMVGVSDEASTHTQTTGTLTWTFSEVICVYGDKRLSFTETQIGVDTVKTVNRSTGEVSSVRVVPFSRSESYATVVPGAGYMPRLGYAFSSPGSVGCPRYFPASGECRAGRSTGRGSSAMLQVKATAAGVVEEQYSWGGGMDQYPPSGRRELLRLP